MPHILDTFVYTSETILRQLKMSSHAHLFQFISAGPALVMQYATLAFSD